MFAANEALIARARAVLWSRRNLLWLIGGSGTGKTTLSRAVAARTGIAVYDMDEAFFGRYHVDPARHPATTAWFSADNPLGWMLSLPWPEFDALYRAANAETLDLLADDICDRADTPLLIDGGITHPSVLVQAIPVERIVCLQTTDLLRAREWESAEGRAEMKDSVLTLPDGEAMWRRFLEYDRLMTQTINQESRSLGIEVHSWDEKVRIEDLVDAVAESSDLLKKLVNSGKS